MTVEIFNKRNLNVNLKVALEDRMHHLWIVNEVFRRDLRWPLEPRRLKPTFHIHTEVSFSVNFEEVISPSHGVWAGRRFLCLAPDEQPTAASVTHATRLHQELHVSFLSFISKKNTHTHTHRNDPEATPHPERREGGVDETTSSLGRYVTSWVGDAERITQKH